MNNIIKVKCPAKINLTLEILNKRDDGFHNIKSIMQMIDLYDYLTIRVKKHSKLEIKLFGENKDIPYNEDNLVYKAIKLYTEECKIDNLLIEVEIEKNIPIAAGLAGGSTDAAGTIWGLNSLLKKFNDKKLHELCSQLGSDLNVCLRGGCNLATSRGEIITKLPSITSKVTLIKPKKLGISAGYAYKSYSERNYKPKLEMTEKMIQAIDKNEDITPFLYNDLEYAIFDKYLELQQIKTIYPEAIMSGSGSTYFILDDIKTSLLNTNNFEFINGLNFISTGVELVV